MSETRQGKDGVPALLNSSCTARKDERFCDEPDGKGVMAAEGVGEVLRLHGHPPCQDERKRGRTARRGGSDAVGRCRCRRGVGRARGISRFYTAGARH